MPGAEIPAEAHDLLRDRPTGHLATIRADGLLSVNPVALMFDGERVRISTTTARQKYRNVAADPRVAISIPHRNNPNIYVEIRGHVEIEPDADRSFIDSIARHYMGRERYPFDPPGTERVTLAIVPRRAYMRSVPLSEDPPARPDPEARA